MSSVWDGLWATQGAQTLIDHGSLGQLIAFLSTHSVPPIPYVVDAEGNTVRHIEHQVLVEFHTFCLLPPVLFSGMFLLRDLSH